jgi:DNA invertase Pin-like site-specific DNA recombinase
VLPFLQEEEQLIRHQAGTAGIVSRKKPILALAYSRTSSAANVGVDKDSEKRQREAIQRFAKAAGYEIAADDWFYDAAVSGADPVDARPGFAAMLTRIASNGVRTIIVETANRFARDLIVQETGHRMLRGLGIDLIAADSPESFVDDTPTATMVRQILGAVAEFEKAALVAKLKGARARKRAVTGKCGGRKSHAEKHPEVVAEAKRLRRASPKTGERRSLRKISSELAVLGYVNERGKSYSAKSVRAMLAQ